MGNPFQIGRCIVVGVIASLGIGQAAGAAEECEVRIPISESGYRYLMRGAFVRDRTVSMRRDTYFRYIESDKPVQRGRVLGPNARIKYKLGEKPRISRSRVLEWRILEDPGPSATSPLPWSVTLTTNREDEPEKRVVDLLEAANHFLSRFELSRTVLLGRPGVTAELLALARVVDQVAQPLIHPILREEIRTIGPGRGIWLATHWAEKQRWQQVLTSGAFELSVQLGRSQYWQGTTLQFGNHELEAEVSPSELCHPDRERELRSLLLALETQWGMRAPKVRNEILDRGPRLSASQRVLQWWAAVRP